MRTISRIDYLDSGLSRPVIEAAIIIMYASAILSYSPVSCWMSERIPFVQALINTVGMVIVYYAYLRGMKPLQHPLTVLWWITIGFNILGFVFTCLGDSASMADASVAASLPLIYLPLGILIIVWYRGNLEHAGILMIIRILVVSVVPVAFYLLGLLEKTSWRIIQEVITIGVELVYVWTLRRTLINRGRR